MRNEGIRKRQNKTLKQAEEKNRHSRIHIKMHIKSFKREGERGYY